MKTKFFSDNGPHCNPIDNQINDWLAENDVKVIDIKFSSNVSAVADSGVSAEYWHTSVLVLYADKPVIANYPEFGESKGAGVGFLQRCVGCDQLITVKYNHVGQAACYDCKERGKT